MKTLLRVAGSSLLFLACCGWSGAQQADSLAERIEKVTSEQLQAAGSE